MVTASAMRTRALLSCLVVYRETARIPGPALKKFPLLWLGRLRAFLDNTKFFQQSDIYMYKLALPCPLSFYTTNQNGEKNLAHPWHCH